MFEVGLSEMQGNRSPTVPSVVVACRPSDFDRICDRLRELPLELSRVASADELLALEDRNFAIAVIDLRVGMRESLAVARAVAGQHPDARLVVVSKNPKPCDSTTLSCFPEHELRVQRRFEDATVDALHELLQFSIRAHPRIELSEESLTLKLNGSDAIGTVCDISLGGVRLRSERPVEAGSRVSFEVHEQKWRGFAKVVRCDGSIAPHSVALHFVRLDPATARSIDRFVRARLQSSRPPPRFRVLRQGNASEQASRESQRTAPKTAIRVRVEPDESNACHYFRVRDLSPSGAFLYGRQPFAHALHVGATASALFITTTQTVRRRVRVARQPRPGTREAFLYPNGIAVKFLPDQPVPSCDPSADD